MRVALKQKTPAPTTPRAREREALHELDDGRLVLEHLAGDAQAFGALVDRYQTRLLNFINRTSCTASATSRKRWISASGSSPPTTAPSSCCVSSKGRATPRSPISPVATWAR